MAMKFIDWLKSVDDRSSLNVGDIDFARIAIPFDQMDSNNPEQYVVRINGNNEVHGIVQAGKYKLTPKRTRLILASNPAMYYLRSSSGSDISKFASSNGWNEVQQFYFVHKDNLSDLRVKMMVHGNIQRSREQIVTVLDSITEHLNTQAFRLQFAEMVDQFAREYESELKKEE